MEYSFGKTLIKVFKNLGVIMALGALSAGVGAIGEVTAELGVYAPLIALGLQLVFSFAIDYLKHKPA
jgi:hypothetical protein